MEVGGWVQVSLGIFFKSSQNNPNPVLIFGSSIPVFCLYVQGCTLLKVVIIKCTFASQT